MSSIQPASDLEKRNLEAHVEMEILREKSTAETLKNLEEKIEDLVEKHKELRALVDDIKDSRNNQLIKWGTAIIISLFSALGMIFLRIIIPAIISKTGGQ